MAKILVVDDEISMRLLYTRELADEGYEVLSASSPREALERFQSEEPDLVILDVRLPGMDGLEVLGRMLSIDRKRPIVLVSAYSFYKENFLSWAADAYLSKSSDTSELKRVVKRLLGALVHNCGNECGQGPRGELEARGGVDAGAHYY